MGHMMAGYARFEPRARNQQHRTGTTLTTRDNRGSQINLRPGEKLSTALLYSFSREQTAQEGWIKIEILWNRGSLLLRSDNRGL